MTLDTLLNFLNNASQATYVGGGAREKNPERQGFTEMVFEKGNFHYRDSWTGYIRSRGMELVRYQGTPVWSSLYGGGMTEGFEDLADECFKFLKKAISSPSKDHNSARGPVKFKQGLWRYSYTQEGDKTEFSGHEEIYHDNKLVFFHRIIGGLIKNKYQPK